MNIIKYDIDRNLDEINTFVNELPSGVKTKLLLKIYKNTYQSIRFFADKPDNFITWICPLLQPNIVSQDSYIYYEND